MADKPTVLTLGGPAAQLEYDLGPSEAFRPETVTAFVDGSGAGSDFVPELSMFSQDGQLLSRTRSDDVVVAGDSGVVTFAPF